MNITTLAAKVDELGKQMLAEQFRFSTVQAEVITHSIGGMDISYSATAFYSGSARSIRATTPNHRQLLKLLKAAIEKELALKAKATSITL